MSQIIFGKKTLGGELVEGNVLREMIFDVFFCPQNLRAEIFARAVCLPFFEQDGKHGADGVGGEQKFLRQGDRVQKKELVHRGAETDGGMYGKDVAIARGDALKEISGGRARVMDKAEMPALSVRAVQLPFITIDEQHAARLGGKRFSAVAQFSPPAEGIEQKVGIQPAPLGDMHPKSWTDFWRCIFSCQEERNLTQSTRQNSR